MTFSFDSIKLNLIEKLQALSNWTQETIYYSIYERLIDIISFATEKLAYYVEFLFKEGNLQTASLYSSINALCYMLGYKPHRKIGAKGFMSVSGDPTFASDYMLYTGPTVSLPKWTMFKNQQNTTSVVVTEDRIYYNNTVISHKYANAGGSAINRGNGRVGIPCTGHAFVVGMYIKISGSNNYDGYYYVDVLTSSSEVVVSAIYVPEVFDGTEEILTGDTDLPVKQGEVKETIYIAEGNVNESIPIYVDSVDEEMIEVAIVDVDNNVLADVSIVDNFYFLDDTANYYCRIDNNRDFSGIQVVFGDNVKVRKLTVGERVRIKFLMTSGADGDISQIGYISQVPDDLLTIDNQYAKNFIYCKNKDQIVGGAGYETVDSIKQNATRLFVTGLKCDSRQDWTSIIESHPLVLKAKVWTEYDLNNYDISPLQNVVYITGVTTTGVTIPVEIQRELANDYLIDRRSLTDVIWWKRLQALNARFRVTGKIRTIPAEQVQQLVYEALNTMYSIENADFKANIYNSNFTKIIDSIAYIVYHETEIYHCEKSEVFVDLDASVPSWIVIVFYPSTLEADTYKQIYLQEGSIELWIKRKINGVWYPEKQIGQCNDINPAVLEGMNNYTIDSGSITYASGNITYLVQNVITDTPPVGEPDYGEPGATFGKFNPTDTDPTGYVFRLMYKTKNGQTPAKLTNDIRFPYFYQISNFDEEDLTCNFSYE